MARIASMRMLAGSAKWLGLAIALWAGLDNGRGDPISVVVALRQFQTEGTSNVHLYLYGLDGKLQKQLTNTPGLDDEAPAFDDEGQTIIFTRTASDPKLKAKAGRYILDLSTGKLRLLTPGMTDNDDEGDYSPSLMLEHLTTRNDFEWPAAAEWGKGAAAITSIGSAYTLISVPRDDASNSFLIKTGDDPKPEPVTGLPGFMPLDEVDYHEALFSANNSPFILGSNMAAAFLQHHLGSTDGESIWGLDLTTKKWTKMSENGGSLYHVANGDGVFMVSDSLYEPLGKTGQSVNCAYLEWWDTHLEMKRLGPPLSVFYGAAIHFNPDANAVIYEICGS